MVLDLLTNGGGYEVKSELPIEGDKMLAKKADKSFAKVLTHDTIGLSGMSALWILGKPLFVLGSDVVINRHVIVCGSGGLSGLC